MLHSATPVETCFATPLHTSFSEKFQRVTAALENKAWYAIPFLLLAKQSSLARVAGVIEEGEGERGRREKMRGIGERGIIRIDRAE